MGSTLPKMVDAKAIAERLGWDIQKVYRMAREKRIPAHKVGFGFVFVEDEIDAWIKQQAEPAAVS